MIEEVFEEPYRILFGKASVKISGDDVTIVALGYMVSLALSAAQSLLPEGISAEVIDLRTVMPMDDATILESVAKTGRLVVTEPAWKNFGVSAEIVTRVMEKGYHYLKAPVARVTFPDTHYPTSFALEDEFFPDENDVTEAVRLVLGKTSE